MYSSCPAFKKDSNPSGRWAVLRFLIPSILFLSLLFNFSSTIAETKYSAIPVEYGRVIYQYNEKSPNHLFIIGMSHRNTLTRLNGNNTSRVQAEVYKIGEWLIDHGGLEHPFARRIFSKKPFKD